MRVRIAQCLCPQRHAILAMVASDDSAVTDQDVLGGLHFAISLLLAGRGLELKMDNMPALLPGHCGLCGAKSAEWIYEVRWSKEFDSWEKAEEAMKNLEKENIATRAMLNLLGVSYDSRKQEMN